MREASGSDRLGFWLVASQLLLLLLVIGGWLAVRDTRSWEAAQSSTESLWNGVTGDDVCAHQPSPDASAPAPTFRLSADARAEHVWLLHHTNANCVIIRAPLPYAFDQRLVLHDDPLIYDYGYWSEFYYSPGAKSENIVNITATGPGGTTVVEGPIDILLSR